MPRQYLFQVNLHFGDGRVSACGLGPKGCIAITARSLGQLLKKVSSKTGLPVERIILTFQPE